MALAAAKAEHLPIRLYTTADGLPSNSIDCVVRDSRGFMWFCTSEGLSRFDGYGFTNYSTEQGLPANHVVDFLESRNGEYWVATADAISHFLPADPLEMKGSADTSRRMFETYRVDPDSRERDRRLGGLVEAADGRIWCATTSGLLRFDPGRGQFDPVEVSQLMYTAILEEPDGSLWLGTDSGLFRRLPGGKLERFGEAEGLPAWHTGNSPHGNARIGGLLRDRHGRLWVATWRGLCRMSASPSPGKRSVERLYTSRDGLTDNIVGFVFESHDGTIWVTTQNGLSCLAPGNEKSRGRFHTYTARRGLDLPSGERPNNGPFAEDSGHNLWMGGLGVKRLARSGIATYTVDDGLATNAVQSVFEDREGRLVAVSGDPRNRFLNVFDGERFLPVVPRVPKSIQDFTWGFPQIHFQDRTGIWWVATSQGLCRYPRVRHLEQLAHTLPDKVFTARDGLSGEDIFALFEDSRGDVWVSVLGPGVVTRWSRSNGSFQNYRQAEQGRRLDTPTRFAEDRAGNVWMSLFSRDLARYRNGRFEVFTAAEGLPEGALTSLFVDHAGRLWLGTSHGGLGRVDDPAAARPRFSFYDTKSGMSSNAIRCITEDAWGRIYAATGHGIDRLDPETRRVRHYSEADGLLYSIDAPAAFRDRHGGLWFGAMRLAPTQDDQAANPPVIRITRVRVRGLERAISELGVSRVDAFRLKPAENQVQIEFASLNFGAGGKIRYQYKLEGLDKDWGPVADSRSVNYAVLAPRSYRFLVRAVNAEEVASSVPASVEFTILPPFWMRWWFWTAAVMALALAAVSAHRYRLRQALELERVRTRIATDLHDDIGSSLTQIAVLSEVVKRDLNGNEGVLGEPLSKIADLSRELVDSMGDIVWSINPHRDHLSDLSYRMRRFASDVFTARNIDFEFTAPAAGENTAVRAELRRQTFLIFKECVHNIVRHAGCTRVEVVLRTEQRRLGLQIGDNGKGFAAPANGHGHGLASMRQRAREMGGRLEIASEAGCGTAVTLDVPLDTKPLRMPSEKTT